MLSKALAALLLSATAAAETTTVATILIPNWSVTAQNPTVTVLGSQADRTTYSISCSIDTSKVLSASAKASSVKSEMEDFKTSMQSTKGKPTGVPDSRVKRWDGGWGGPWEACIPWEITQGPSTWAVHYTATDVWSMERECTFGNGGIGNGDATCIARGTLDPDIWGESGTATHTFHRSDVDDVFLTQTLSVTAGGKAVETGTGSPASVTSVLTDSRGTPTATAIVAAQNTGLAARLAVPTGAVAMVGAAGGILAAALAL
ncbi:hypothetical protein K469DRAFT_753054 [Zopfia rhizophila CBS 207.26]|uniref:Uncharacterized protein n=1 Tax=Zopfia rhizophila CBS 207.26 TaxID=1314779 RepID=A0A6A6DN51_9PEZI|nr:hypothetical protein K469DRAFT_753054 [Zopfia rhizophila CBS 207.26]